MNRNKKKIKEDNDVSASALLNDLDFLQHQVEMMAAKDIFSKKKGNGDEILFDSLDDNFNITPITNRDYLQKSNK